MFRQNRLAFTSLFLIVALLFVSLRISPAKALDDDFPVTIQLTGVIQSVSSTQLDFTNGTTVKINPGTQDIAPNLSAGMAVVIVAEMDDEQFVAKSIQVADSTSVTSTTPSDDSKDKGKGNNANASDDDKGGKGKGKGNSNNVNDDDKSGKGGKGNSKNNGKDKGKGDNANDDDKGGKGKGKGNDKNNGKGKGQDEADKEKAACLARTDQPVATQLANSLDVSYAEIMKWHCDGTGFGEIARAYVIAKNSTLTVAQIFAMRKAHKGWGQIIKATGLTGKDIGGLGKLMGKQAQ